LDMTSVSTTDAGDRLMWYCWSWFDLRLVWSQCGSIWSLLQA
jgi:hypothetical protein